VFLLPVHYDGAWTILLGVASDSLKVAIGDFMPALLLLLLSISAVLTVAASASARVQHRFQRSSLGRVFLVPPRWLLPRLLGSVCAWLIVFKLGPEFIWHGNSGGVALYSLAGTIVTIFLCAAFLLPLLTDFGLMEFVGTMLQPLFYRLFTLPGRAAVDAMASWLSSAAVGVLLTLSQYERAQYSRREAAVIATNFSITSLPFCLFVVQFIGLREHFFAVYSAIIAIGFCCAIVLPRIPPLKRLEDSYAGAGAPVDVGAAGAANQAQSLLQRATLAARHRAARAPGPRAYLTASLQHLLDIWMGLLPLVVLIGTLGLALAEFTPVMRWLAAPLAPVLTFAGLPEAAAAAPAFLVGFLDMFLPAAIGQGVESELTRFVIAAVSLTQLIYLSEVGALLLRSSLRLGIGTLLAIFVLRTLIAFPIALLAANLTLG
jgi:nucleoside recognition membrane protein YjiH